MVQRDNYHYFFLQRNEQARGNILEKRWKTCGWPTRIREAVGMGVMMIMMVKVVRMLLLVVMMMLLLLIMVNLRKMSHWSILFDFLNKVNTN